MRLPFPRISIYVSRIGKTKQKQRLREQCADPVWSKMFSLATTRFSSDGTQRGFLSILLFRNNSICKCVWLWNLVCILRDAVTAYPMMCSSLDIAACLLPTINTQTTPISVIEANYVHLFTRTQHSFANNINQHISRDINSFFRLLLFI